VKVRVLSWAPFLPKPKLNSSRREPRCGPIRGRPRGHCRGAAKNIPPILIQMAAAAPANST
jgi:hypothetical protein